MLSPALQNLQQKIQELTKRREASSNNPRNLSAIEAGQGQPRAKAQVIHPLHPEVFKAPQSFNNKDLRDASLSLKKMNDIFISYFLYYNGCLRPLKIELFEEKSLVLTDLMTGTQYKEDKETWVAI